MSVIITKSIRNIAIAKGLDPEAIVWVVEHSRAAVLGDTATFHARDFSVQVKRNGTDRIVVGIKHRPKVNEPKRVHTRQGARYAKRFHQTYGTYDLSAA